MNDSITIDKDNIIREAKKLYKNEEYAEAFNHIRKNLHTKSSKEIAELLDIDKDTLTHLFKHELFNDKESNSYKSRKPNQNKINKQDYNLDMSKVSVSYRIPAYLKNAIKVQSTKEGYDNATNFVIDILKKAIDIDTLEFLNKKK